MRINIFIIFLFMHAASQAQSYEIDRLKKEIIAHPARDSFRVNRLNQLCNSSPMLPYQDIEKLSNEALKISTEIGYSIGEGYALIGKSIATFYKGNISEAISLMGKADFIAKNTGDVTLQTWVLIRSSFLYSENDNRKALSYALQAKDLATKTGNKRLLSISLSTVTSCYTPLGDYSTAMEYSLKALKAAEEAGCVSCAVIARGKIANIYSMIGDYGKSNEYYRQYLEDRKNLGYNDSANYAVYNNIGENYRYSGKYKEALDQYRLSLSLTNDLYSVITSKSNIAEVYLQLDSLKPAFDYAFTALALSKQLNVVYSLGWIDGILSRAYLKRSNPDSALYYARAGLEASEKSGALEFMRDNALALSNAYLFINDYKNAYKYNIMYFKYRDSLMNNQIENRTTVLMHNYELEKKEDQIALLNQEKKSQQVLLTAILMFLLLILAGVVVLVRNNRQKEKAKRKAESAYSELRATQAQLIHSEKMASLGELTAGIAHEIQNPLNFVNNFSEVSSELIEEMKEELKKGSYQDAGLIADDIKQNLEKINHHGQRAAAIVKGMLQHSRSSSGTKEMTDINALCDEYVRLAYHGLRAKDKSFNAKFETVFDDSIGKINIMPQEIGRVVLNLINNAFYAVNEKAKSVTHNAESYEPAVTVSTKKENGKVMITVADNGTGIPQKVVDKIFQPFFTTKPTGEGTGLGLSLSYDIITKGHNGELKVETKEGEGTTFMITLPV